jgi:tetratricopeptide (TPR) repeat protein
MNLDDKINEIEESLKDFYEMELREEMWLAFKAEDYEKLLKITNLLLDSDAEYSTHYFYRGIAKYKLGYLRAAAVDFTNCLDIDEELYIEAYYYRGICNDNTMDFERAAKLGHKPSKAILQKIASQRKK